MRGATQALIVDFYLFFFFFFGFIIMRNLTSLGRRNDLLGPRRSFTFFTTAIFLLRYISFLFIGSTHTFNQTFLYLFLPFPKRRRL